MEVTLVNKRNQVMPLLLKEKWAKGRTKTTMLGPKKKITLDDSTFTQAITALINKGVLRKL